VLLELLSVDRQQAKQGVLTSHTYRTWYFCVWIMLKPPLSLCPDFYNFRLGLDYDHFPRLDLHRPLKKQVLALNDDADRNTKRTKCHRSFYWRWINVFPRLRRSGNSTASVSSNAESGW